MNIKDELKKHLIADLHLEDIRPEDIADAAPLFGEEAEGLGLDSLDAVELVVLLQKRFNVTVKSMEEARDAFTTLDALAAFVQSRQSGA
ncbi:MAG: phosphopantetheine-binding protein [Candidatus Adiutrix sp.]|jgi:acyl carrier protein|nr:phosphopantetheine-binding protein [Candidatus Adiutrix sp.]